MRRRHDGNPRLCAYRSHHPGQQQPLASSASVCEHVGLVEHVMEDLSKTASWPLRFASHALRHFANRVTASYLDIQSHDVASVYPGA